MQLFLAAAICNKGTGKQMIIRKPFFLEIIICFPIFREKAISWKGETDILGKQPRRLLLDNFCRANKPMFWAHFSDGFGIQQLPIFRAHFSDDFSANRPIDSLFGTGNDANTTYLWSTPSFLSDNTAAISKSMQDRIAYKHFVLKVCKI